VSCHGAEGHGDGPASVGLEMPPADLTAPHLWDHPDGELFWWISHGMFGPDGKRVMTGFAATLDEDTSWALIDFLHANNPNGQVMPGMHHH
jgi:mono/diheme cytochrome c family protein